VRCGHTMYPWTNPLDPARFEGLGRRARLAAETEGRACALGGLCGGHSWATPAGQADTKEERKEWGRIL